MRNLYTVYKRKVMFMKAQKNGLTSLSAGLQKVYNGSKQAQMKKAEETEQKLEKISIKLAGPVVKPF